MVGLVAVRLDHRVLVGVKVRPDNIIWQQWGKMVTYKNFLSLLVNLFVDQRRRRRRFLSAGWWQYCLCLPRWLATAAAAVVDTRWHWVRAGARQVVVKFKFKVLIRYNNLSHFELYPSVNCGENKRCANLHSNLFLSSKNTFTLTHFTYATNSFETFSLQRLIIKTNLWSFVKIFLSTCIQGTYSD